MYREDAHEDRSLLLVGVNRKLVAYRRETGEVAWTYANESAYGYYVDFVIVARRVYVAVGRYILCLDYPTGNPLFSTELESGALRLMLDEERLYALGDDHIWCIDLDGRKLWSRPHELNSHSVMPTFGFPGNVTYGFRDSG
jgi:outer membrane protein assembly factor BamB